MRHEAGQEVLRLTEEKCRELVESRSMGIEAVRNLVNAAKSLFCDDSSVWPLHSTAFYLGRVPNVTALLGQEQWCSLDLRRRAHFFASLWHTHSIRLAKRIWGQVQRLAASEAGLT